MQNQNNHNRYISYFNQLQAKPKLWFGGLLITIGSLFLGSFPAQLFTKYYSQAKGWDLNTFRNEVTINAQLANVYLFFNLVPYLIAAIALVFVYKFYLRGNALLSIKPQRKIRLSKLLVPGLIWFAMSLSMDAYQIINHPELYTFSFELSTYIPLILIGLFILPIQTSFEEVLFRNYIQNGLSIYSKNAWVGLIISSVVFGLMHSFNPEISKYGFLNMMPFYMYFGFVLGLIAMWDESLEIPLSLHFFNNLYTLLVVSLEDSALKVRPLFVQSEVDILSTRWYFLLSVTIMFIIVAIIFKFKWPVKTKWE